MKAKLERLKITARDEHGQHVASTMSTVAEGVALTQAPEGPSASAFKDDAEAARFYLSRALGRAPGRAMRSLAPEEPPTTPAADHVPDLVERSAVQQLSISETKLVSFDQLKNNIPVFGARTTVEIGESREFVSASVNVADVEDVATTPEISAEKAAGYLVAELGGQSEVPTELPTPQLVILPLDEQDPRLVWHFHAVRSAPPTPEFAEGEGPPSKEIARCCDLGASPFRPSYDYFVAADNGELVYSFSNHAHVEIPTWCRGEDEDQVERTFYGHSQNGSFSMNNRFEDIRTFDLELQLIETTPLPTAPIQNATNNWAAQNRAAVSAHVNATRVMDFLFGVLRRDSIDDQGMALENIVNCVSEDVDPADRPEWVNAAWFNGRMWYGQRDVGGGSFQSLSRFLDIIGHELFHGVTEATAGLVYRDLAGALNESMSDIFGVIINNWYSAPNRNDVATWNWEMGPGLNASGGPLRNMANPGSVGRWWRPDGAGGWQQVIGYPAHMNDYVVLPSFYDHGGVHIFSNIHNLAAHNVLTSQLPGNGDRVFAPEEVAVLYYLTLTRLGPLDDFSDARAELLTVADVIYGGSTVRRGEVRTAIEDAYDAVGIA